MKTLNRRIAFLCRLPCYCCVINCDAIFMQPWSLISHCTVKCVEVHSWYSYEGSIGVGMVHYGSPDQSTGMMKCLYNHQQVMQLSHATTVLTQACFK